MNKKDYPTLHLDTNESKETACNMIGNAWLSFVSKCNVG
jgi:hypothetical protein